MAELKAEASNNYAGYIWWVCGIPVADSLSGRSVYIVSVHRDHGLAALGQYFDPKLRRIDYLSAADAAVEH